MPNKLRRSDRFVTIITASNSSQFERDFRPVGYRYINCSLRCDYGTIHDRDTLHVILIDRIIHGGNGIIPIIVKNSSFAKSVADCLSARGFPVCSIHGEKSDRANAEAFQAFQSKSPLLIIEDSQTYMLLGLNSSDVRRVILYGNNVSFNIRFLDNLFTVKRRVRAANTIFCCYRRYQLEKYFRQFRLHRAARKIQR